MRQFRTQKSSENKIKDQEICYVNGREFKITALKKLNEMQENTVRQFIEFRKQTNEQNEYFTN